MKLTKKAIKEAPEYIIMLDPKACGASEKSKNGFYKRLGCELYFKALSANTIIEAMKEAESYFDDTTYLITLSEKTGEVDTESESIIYKDILTTRANSNWHICDREHSERPCFTNYNPEFKFFDLYGNAF